MTDGGAAKGEWYLPSQGELYKIVDNKTIIGGLPGTYYWSSTESTIDNYSATIYDFTCNPACSYHSPKSNTFSVRAIRAF